MNDRLDELFRAVPREITPPDGVWPAIVAKTRRASRPRRLPALIAGALLIFLGGLGTGTALSHPRPTPFAETVDSPFLAAARVQETGTAYVRAIMLLRDRAGAAAPDHAAVTQGREVALATLDAARRAVEAAP